MKFYALGSTDEKFSAFNFPSSKHKFFSSVACVYVTLCVFNIVNRRKKQKMSKKIDSQLGMAPIEAS